MAKSKKGGLSIADVKKILDNEKSTLNLILEAKAEAIEMIKAGKNIPGYTIEKTYTNRKWTKEVTVEKLLSKFKKHIPRKTDYQVTKIISPAALEKMLLTIPEARNVIKTFTTREESGHKLIRGD